MQSTPSPAPTTSHTIPPSDPAALMAWAQSPEGIAFFQRASDAMVAAQAGGGPTARIVRLETPVAPPAPADVEGAK